LFSGQRAYVAAGGQTGRSGGPGPSNHPPGGEEHLLQNGSTAFYKGTATQDGSYEVPADVRVANRLGSLVNVNAADKDALEALAANKELKSFIENNYDWAIQGGRRRGPVDHNEPDLETTVTVPEGGTLRVGGQVIELMEKLGRNEGQKVTVNSINVNGDARTAAALGVRFVRGNNGVVYGVIDEAQFRSLMELDAQAARRGRAVAANGRMQDTIVGTDALIANDMLANVSFVADKGNTLNVADNTIALPHESYLLIDNGTYLTAVRAGPMQHWTEKPAAVQFVEVPQNIEVPRVGQLVKLEKTLLEPSDPMVIRAQYTWKEGVSK